MEVSNKKDWLRERATGIGGSDASVILGINPWKSRLELWHEKVNGVLIENNIESPDLYWGKKLEPFIIEEYVELTKRDIEAGTLALENIRSKMFPFMMANLDGKIINKEKGDGVLEIKTKGCYVKWNDEIPSHYYSQIQHYMAVTGLTWASFCVMDMGKKGLFWKDVVRDEDYIKNLIEEESKFWELVKNKTPPDVDGSESCTEFLKNKYSKEEKGKEISLVGNMQAKGWASELKDIKEELKDIKAKETECKNHLMGLMEDAEIGIGEDYKITWKRPKARMVFDSERFEKEHEELYSQYLVEEESVRRFTVKFEEK